MLVFDSLRAKPAERGSRRIRSGRSAGARDRAGSPEVPHSIACFTFYGIPVSQAGAATSSYFLSARSLKKSFWLKLRKRGCRGEFEDFPGRWIELLEPSP